MQALLIDKCQATQCLKVSQNAPAPHARVRGAHLSEEAVLPLAAAALAPPAACACSAACAACAHAHNFTSFGFHCRLVERALVLRKQRPLDWRHKSRHPSACAVLSGNTMKPTPQASNHHCYHYLATLRQIYSFAMGFLNPRPHTAPAAPRAQPRCMETQNLGP